MRHPLPRAEDRPALIGLGNRWRHDDGAGLEVVRRVRLATPDAAVLALESEPSGLIDAMAGGRAVVIVDAVSSGSEPGTVHRIDAAAGPVPTSFGTSSHHLGVGDAIELARELGRLPASVELLGIEGADFRAGQGLSAPVANAVETVVGELLERVGSPATAPPRARDRPRHP